MTNTIIFDNAGKPSIMVRIPQFKISDVIPGGKDATHPAFIIDGVEVPEIYISKYQNIIANERAYSLPFQKPATSLDFDTAKQYCEAKGAGWHLMTNAEWAAIALWCKKNGTMPHGNNNRGKDYAYPKEQGITYDGYRTLTGTGPETWAHDHTQEGIFDLNGNVWEWIGGLRLQDGEIQIIPDNNAAKHIDQGAASTEWQPIALDGKTLKCSETEDGLKLTTDSPEGNWNGCYFKNLETDIEVPDILKELALYPADNAEHDGYFWADINGERLPYRGGYWDYASGAGLFSLSLSYPRSGASNSVGFRSAFVNP
jgi:hypothetical protein